MAATVDFIYIIDDARAVASNASELDPYMSTGLVGCQIDLVSVYVRVARLENSIQKPAKTCAFGLVFSATRTGMFAASQADRTFKSDVPRAHQNDVLSKKWRSKT